MRPKKKPRGHRPVSVHVDRVWKAIRHARRFSYDAIAAVTALDHDKVVQITKPWRHTGILRAMRDGFRLARDLGPEPPFRKKGFAGLVSSKDGELLPFLAELMPPPPLSKEEARARRLERARLYYVSKRKGHRA